MKTATWSVSLALLGITLAGPARQIHAASAHGNAALALPRCHTAALRASIGGQNAGAGSIFTTIVLRNVSRVTCTTAGYAGVSLVDSRHGQIGQPARWDPGVVHVITLRPGAAASTTVRSLNPGVGTTNCLPPSAALRIYPPNERTSLLVAARLSECLGTLDVKPLVFGTAGL
jgi:hypothetical protein